jgi:hypothetical protein
VVQASPDSIAATIDADSIATAVLADTLVAATPDSFPVFTVLGLQIVEVEGHVAPDSTSAQVAHTDSAGVYRLRRLPPGYWHLRAFLDQNDNQRYDPGEPAAPPMDSVRVVPVEDSEEIDFIVPRWPPARRPGSGEE